MVIFMNKDVDFWEHLASGEDFLDEKTRAALFDDNTGKYDDPTSEDFTRRIIDKFKNEKKLKTTGD
jgi:hypothetical protein